MKHIFIVNQISGKGAAIRLVDLIHQTAKELGLDYEIRITEYPQHAKEIAEEYKDCYIYSVGGDGTLLEILNGFDFSNTISAIPAGSGNDFFRYFGGTDKDFPRILKDSILSDSSVIDYGESNVMRFLNTTSIGMDALINIDASNMIRKTFVTKGPAYILSIIKNMITLKATHADIEIDGMKTSGDFYIISCMNGKFYGNGVNAAPDADLTDGMFDLCLFRKTNRFKAYSLLGKYLKGDHNPKYGFESYRCKHVVISGTSLMPCQSDGENYMTDSLDLKVIHNHLKIKIPQRYLKDH